LLAEIGGQMCEDEAKRLILKKLFDLVNSELNRYLNFAMRELVQESLNRPTVTIARPYPDKSNEKAWPSCHCNK
jgi:hypothetical protein